MVQLHRAILVDVDQRPGLVQERGGEGDPEAHRGQRQSAPQRRPPGVGIGLDNRGAAGAVVGGFGELGHQLGQDVVLHPHAVGGDPALVLPVEIGEADIQRVAQHCRCDPVHDPFCQHHALWPAKAAEGSVRHRVRLRAQRGQLKAGVEIGIVGVEHGAIVDRPAQVVAIAAAAGHGAFDARDPTGVIEADGIVDAEVVALAGEHEVVIPVEAEPDRATGALHPQRCDHGERGCLGFLAAKGAAHAADFDGDLSRTDPQRSGGKVLNL